MPRWKGVVPPQANPQRPRQRPAPDIDVVPFKGALPLSRGAVERRLNRTDRFDRRAQVTGYETLTTTGTVRITFAVVDDEPWTFDPGHFVGIRADIAQAGSRRSPYCISSPPNDHRTFRLLVRLVPQGPLSIYLGGLHMGDVITFRGPSGRSMMPEDDETEMVLLATGVGIGPLLSFLQQQLPDGWEAPIQLFWGLRQVEDICLLDELDGLAGEHANFRYQISLSQPPRDWAGLRGRLTESVPPLLPTLGGKRFYLVGNGAMVEEVSSVLSDMGVDKKQIYEEAYFNVRYRPHPGDLAQIRSRFVASDLFAPYQHQQAGLFMPETPLSRRRPTG